MLHNAGIMLFFLLAIHTYYAVEMCYVYVTTCRLSLAVFMVGYYQSYAFDTSH